MFTHSPPEKQKSPSRHSLTSVDTGTFNRPASRKSGTRVGGTLTSALAAQAERLVTGRTAAPEGADRVLTHLLCVAGPDTRTLVYV